MKRIEIKYQVPGFVIIGLIVFLVVKFTIPMFKDFRLGLTVQEIVDYNTDIDPKPPDPWEARDTVQRRARELSINLPSDQIVINTMEDSIEITIKYLVVIDLYVTKVPWKFESVYRTSR